MANLCTQYPGRFGAFALLPMPDVEAYLEEISYALDVLHLDGVGLLSNYQEQYLGDRVFDPVFDELQRRKACVYEHPSVPPASMPKPEFVGLDFLEEFCFHTTRAATNLVLSGTMERCPDVKIILSHMGGTLPYLGWRLNTCYEGISAKQKPGALSDIAWSGWKSLSKPFYEYLSMFYFDTALAAHKVAFEAVETIAPGHTMFGSDSFYASLNQGKTFVENIEAYYANQEQKRESIAYKTAQQLFPRFLGI